MAAPKTMTTPTPATKKKPSTNTTSATKKTLGTKKTPGATKTNAAPKTTSATKKTPAKQKKPAARRGDPVDTLAKELKPMSEWDACAALRKLPSRGRGALAVALIERGVKVRGVAFDEDDDFARRCVPQMLRHQGIDFTAVRDGENVYSVDATQLRDVVFDELRSIREQHSITWAYAPRGALPARFAELAPLLVQLRFARSDVGALPPVIGRLTKLHDLSIEFGELTRLGAPLGKLTQLRKLLVACPRMKALPLEVCKLPRLEVLRLPRARMRSLPPQIGKLASLVELDLSFSQISSLPPELARCKRLAKVTITYSKLKRAKVEKLLPHVQIVDDVYQ